MLQQISNVEGCRVLAEDGELGHVEEVYFDDEQWIVRHVVVATGGWFGGREILIPPQAVKLVRPESRAVAVHLTKDQVSRSPSIDTDRPVSRRCEALLSRHYGSTPYWEDSAFGVFGSAPVVPPSPKPLRGNAVESSDLEAAALEVETCHLRSSGDVAGYRVLASDGRLGHLDDLVLDDESWAIRYLVIDTREWLPGRSVLTTPNDIAAFDWATGSLRIEQTRDELRHSPGLELLG